MPDIAMCSGTGCPRRNECYRHRALPNGDRQSWFAQPPIKADLSCDAFKVIYQGQTRLREPT